MMEFDVSLTSPQKVTKDSDKKGKKTSIQKGDDRKYHIGESKESEVKQSYQEKSKKSNQPSASCDKPLVHGVVQDAEFSDTSASFEVATDTILHTAKGRQIVMKSNCSSPNKVAEDKLNDDFTADLEFLNLVKKMHEEEKLFKSKSAPELSGKVKRSKKSKEEQKIKIKKDQVSSCEKVSTDTSLNGNSLKSEVTACVTEGIKGIRENVEKSEPEQKCVTKPLVAKTTESIKTNKRSSAFQVHVSLKENINLFISSKEGLVINQIECASEKEQEEESVNGHNSSNIQHVHDVKESNIVCKSSQTEEERIPHEKKQSLSDSDNYLVSGDESDIKDQSKCSDGLSQRGSVELGFDTLEELIFDTKNLEKKSLMCVDEKECDGEFKVPTCYTPTFGPPNLSDAIRLTAYAANTASPLMYNSSTSSSPGKLIINENIPSTPHSEISMEVETSETVSHCDKNGDEKLTESVNDEAEECVISQSDEKEDDLCSVNDIARSEGSENGVSKSEGSVNDSVRSECSDNDIVRSECSDNDPSKSECSDNDIVRSECSNNGIATNEFSDIGVAEVVEGECSDNEMATSDVEGSSYKEGEVNESKQEEEKKVCTGLTIKSESSSTSSDASIKLDMEKSSPKRYFKQISIDSIRNSIKSKLQEKDESINEKLDMNQMPSVCDEAPFDGEENLIKIQKDSNKVEDKHVDSLEDDLVLSDPESETDKEVRDISEQSMSNEMSYKVYEHSSVNMMELAEMSQSKSGTSVIPSSSEENDSGLCRKEKVEIELECGISPEEEGQNDYDEEFSGSCEVTSETESITEFYDEESRLDLEDIASLREHDGFRIRRQSYENQSLKVEEIDAGVNYKRRNSSASSEDEELDKSSEKFVKGSGKKCVLDSEKEDGEIASTESEQDNKDMQINKSTILENKLQVDFKLSKSPEINDEKRCVRSASIEKAQMVKDTGKSSVRERRASDDDISNSHDRKRIKISRTERDSRTSRDDPRKDTYSGSRSSARYSSERVGSSSPYSFTRSRDSRHGSDERQTREHNSRHGSGERQTREHNSPSYRVKRESRTKSSEQYSDRHRESKYTSSRSRHESSDENNPKRDEKLKKREQITFHNLGSTSRSRPPRDRHSDTDSDYKEKQIPRKSHHESHIQSNKSERRDTLGAKRSSVLSNLYESSESSRSYGSSSRQRSLSKKDDTEKKASVKENVSNRTRSKERVSRHASGSDRYESRSRHR
ncbi:hypothetical protein FSP39_013044 [Pinctada imbricata]|uniref:Uncharacterized protein n=1 Tax=Pinctada imbricata TaxID=66713 RepID=A0AA88Y4E1_PINIB|nr:hypothetical protein FSP39_013044 [Pinctada imbricata]